jgi:hypothetical protein
LRVSYTRRNVAVVPAAPASAAIDPCVSTSRWASVTAGETSDVCVASVYPNFQWRWLQKGRTSDARPGVRVMFACRGLLSSHHTHSVISARPFPISRRNYISSHFTVQNKGIKTRNKYSLWSKISVGDLV